MAILIKLISNYDVWVYGACAIAALVLLRLAVMARRDRLQASFTLEREAAHNREVRVITAAFVVLLLMGAVYAVDRFVAPNVAVVYEPTPTPTVMFLPTITSTPAPTATSTNTPTPRPTPRPLEPLATWTPTPPKVIAPPCANPGVSLTAPGLGTEVRGAVQVTGSANIPRFQFYKLEYGIGENPATWYFMLSGCAPVSGGVLGVWDTSPLPAGVYSLRLVVVDQTGNFPEPCKTVVTIVK